jgi:hypothetical protein
MEWIDRLQAPGLILAGAVIYLLYKLLMRLVDFCMQSLQHQAEQRATLNEAIGLLRQLCSKAKLGGQE